jgi:hypothetical protein
MNRLNLTLDDVTWEALGEHARVRGKARAAMARELIQEAMERREAVARRRKLASDYAADAGDLELLAQIEAAQLELLDDAEG